MNQELLQEVGKTQRLEILNTIKKTRGLSVKELAEKLDMSYMGVKSHCLALHKQGYLDTAKRAKTMGRPELIYRLTKHTLDLFPRVSNALTQDLLLTATELYGEDAPEKLLSSYFKDLTARYKKQVKGKTLADKAAALVKARETDGYMTTLAPSVEGTTKIVEYHHPMFDLLDSYPLVGKLEAEMFTALLGKPTTRTAVTASGLYMAEFVVE